jgi:hypothetical protein
MIIAPTPLLVASNNLPNIAIDKGTCVFKFVVYTVPVLSPRTLHIRGPYDHAPTHALASGN